MSNKFQVNHLSFSFLKEGTPVLSSVSLNLKSSGSVALLGHNGSGKTTLLKLMSGLINENAGSLSGDVLYQQKSIFKMSPLERTRTVCYLGSDLNVEFNLTVREVVELGFYSRKKVDLEKLKLAFELLRLAPLLNRDVRTLSGGERQRVLLARGLVVDPQVLILDETFSKMDIENQIEVGALLRKVSQNKLILLVSHDLNFSLSWADELLLLKSGQVLGYGDALTLGVPEKLDQIYSDKKMSWLKNPESNRFQIAYPFTCK